MQILAPRDGIEEVGVDKLFPGIPNVVVLLINNGVLVRVVVVGSKARQGGKEILEGSKVDKEGSEETGGRQWGRGSDCGNRGFNDWWGNILDRDVLK